MRLPRRQYVETIEFPWERAPRVRYTGPFWTRMGAARALTAARAAAPRDRPEETLLRLVSSPERLAHLADPNYPARPRPTTAPAVVDVRDTARARQDVGS